MRKKTFLAFLCSAGAAFSLAACSSMEALGSDADIVAAADKGCAQYDAKNKITTRYDARMRNIRKGLPASVGGQTLNYRVYQTTDMNAWAMPNGCVRVYSALLDRLNDDEVRAVLGHEIGHVALRHSVKQYRNSNGIAIATAAGSAISNTFGFGIFSTLQDVTAYAISAQYSQALETEADNYSVDLLLREDNGREKALAMASALKKISSGGSSSMLQKMFGDHPDTDKRISNVEDRVKKASGR